MRDDQVLLDVHQVVNARATELRKLLPAFLEEDSNVVALLALNDAPVSSTVPVRIGDLDVLVLECLLVLEPLAPELLPLLPLARVALTVWQKRRVNCWVFENLRFLRWRFCTSR